MRLTNRARKQAGFDYNRVLELSPLAFARGWLQKRFLQEVH